MQLGGYGGGEEVAGGGETDQNAVYEKKFNIKQKTTSLGDFII